MKAKESAGASAEQGDSSDRFRRALLSLSHLYGAHHECERDRAALFGISLLAVCDSMPSPATAFWAGKAIRTAILLLD